MGEVNNNSQINKQTYNPMKNVKMRNKDVSDDLFNAIKEKVSQGGTVSESDVKEIYQNYSNGKEVNTYEQIKQEANITSLFNQIASKDGDADSISAADVGIYEVANQIAQTNETNEAKNEQIENVTNILYEAMEKYDSDDEIAQAIADETGLDKQEIIEILDSVADYAEDGQGESGKKLSMSDLAMAGGQEFNAVSDENGIITRDYGIDENGSRHYEKGKLNEYSEWEPIIKSTTNSDGTITREYTNSYEDKSKRGTTEIGSFDTDGKWKTQEQFSETQNADGSILKEYTDDNGMKRVEKGIVDDNGDWKPFTNKEDLGEGSTFYDKHGATTGTVKYEYDENGNVAKAKYSNFIIENGRSIGSETYTYDYATGTFSEKEISYYKTDEE